MKKVVCAGVVSELDYCKCLSHLGSTLLLGYKLFVKFALYRVVSITVCTSPVPRMCLVNSRLLVFISTAT